MGIPGERGRTRVSVADTHCHLDLYPDYERVIEETERAGVDTIAVTNAPSMFRACVTLTRGCRFVHPAVGLHPELVSNRYHELRLLPDLLDETRFVGEVGLDFRTRDEGERTLQREAFREILDRCAGYGDKILTIHSRRSAEEVVDMVGPEYPGSVILHWFSGTHSALRRAISYGFYFSVNPAMLDSASGRRTALAVPPEKLLVETDGPFVAVGSRPARPRDVKYVVAGLADLFQVDVPDLAHRLKNNYEEVLRRSGGSTRRNRGPRMSRQTDPEGG
jgi:TatD DNase family protein